MHDNGPNPYQPVVLDSAVPGDDLASEVSFRLTPALLYHAESQYLLHLHPMRLLFGSLAMIAACCIGFWISMPFGVIPFLVTLAAMMLVCAVIYLALVRQSKRQIRKRLHDHGLVRGSVCTVKLDDENLEVTAAGRTHRWPIRSARVYRTAKGMLLCPVPLLFVFVPKQSDSPVEAFDLMLRRARSA